MERLLVFCLKNTIIAYYARTKGSFPGKNGFLYVQTAVFILGGCGNPPLHFTSPVGSRRGGLPRPPACEALLKINKIVFAMPMIYKY